MKINMTLNLGYINCGSFEKNIYERDENVYGTQENMMMG